jgi:hypothetical protein
MRSKIMAGLTLLLVLVMAHAAMAVPAMVLLSVKGMT